MAAGSYERKEFVGGAPPRELTAPLTDSATSLTIDDAAGWPTATTDPFVIVVDRGLDSEEKILVATRTGTTLSGLTRGYDDTTGLSHASGAVVEHAIDASTLDQANRYVNLQTTKGDIVVHDGTNPVRVAFAGDDNDVLKANASAPSGLEFGRLKSVAIQASAPSAAGNVRFWYSTTYDMLLVSDGSSWLPNATLPSFPDDTARDLLFGGTPTQTGITCLVAGQPQVWNGSEWEWLALASQAIPKYSNAAARDAAITSPSNGDHAYLTGSSALTEYRGSEWITINQKITVSEVAPTGALDGDVWLQPL